jgi:hypothetical protein
MRFELALVAVVLVACAAPEPQEPAKEEEVATDPNFGKDIPGYKEAPNIPRGVADDGPAEEAAPAGKPHWDACADDGECQSKWCGCAYGTKKVCLPATTFPKTCESSQPAGSKGGADGQACTANDQCASKVCDCAQGGAKKQCLASSAFVTACSSGKPLGDACGNDNDCASKICGCSNSPKKKCVPNKQWITKCG